MEIIWVVTQQTLCTRGNIFASRAFHLNGLYKRVVLKHFSPAPTSENDNLPWTQWMSWCQYTKWCQQAGSDCSHNVFTVFLSFYLRLFLVIFQLLWSKCGEKWSKFIYNLDRSKTTPVVQGFQSIYYSRSAWKNIIISPAQSIVNHNCKSSSENSEIASQAQKTMSY